MASNNNTIYQTPPLAGRPPFATDDDHLYDKEPQPASRRLRVSPSPDPNERTSAYNVYDNYLENGNRDSGIDSLGKGMMNGDMDDEDPFDDSHQTHKQQPIPIAAPRPGYAAPVSALQLARPSPAASPDGRQPSPQMSQVPKPLTLVSNLQARSSPPSAISVPNMPHPLPPTMTPITPVFARPAKVDADRGVKFAASTPILRSDKEETLLPKRGEKGDDFWRRFSMVVKEESSKPSAQKTSAWLSKTQNGASSLSRWIWVVGILLLLCIAGGIGIGEYISHTDKTPDEGLKAIGGSANEKLVSSLASAGPSGAAEESGSSSVYHVTPTHTVARRDALPSGTPLAHLPLSFDDAPHIAGRAHANHSARNRRNHLNRID